MFSNNKMYLQPVNKLPEIRKVDPSLFLLAPLSESVR